MTPAGAPMVFVIDDDAAVRTFIPGLLTLVGLRSESFGTAQSSRYVTGQILLVDGGISTGSTRALASSAPYKPAASS